MIIERPSLFPIPGTWHRIRGSALQLTCSKSIICQLWELGWGTIICLEHLRGNATSIHYFPYLSGSQVQEKRVGPERITGYLNLFIFRVWGSRWEELEQQGVPVSDSLGSWGRLIGYKQKSSANWKVDPFRQQLSSRVLFVEHHIPATCLPGPTAVPGATQVPGATRGSCCSSPPPAPHPILPAVHSL